jgi:predicted alpha/beta-fold hydrolase
MPVIDSEYKPLRRYRNAYIQTVLPTLLRKVTSVNYTRQRINTSDGDFIDLDWSLAAANKVPAELWQSFAMGWKDHPSCLHAGDGKGF